MNEKEFIAQILIGEKSTDSERRCTERRKQQGDPPAGGGVVDRRLGLDRRRGPGRRRTEERKAAEEGLDCTDDAELWDRYVGPVVSLPGEIFVELGLAIKKASPFKHTFIAELANGSIGYIPNRSAYAEGNYEVVSARCAEGSGEMLVDAAVKLLKELARQGR